jgi:myo-inositol 2-dehydrogenase / D-chiro-inositol 1-dehydrogenase
MKHFYQESSACRGARGSAAITGSKGTAKFSLAIIGTGMMGREHMRVATLLGRAQVHGIYDTSASSLDQAEADFSRYSTSELIRYSSLESACSDPNIDALIVSTPNFTHWAVVKEALLSGKALLIEKPMATCLNDANAMTQAAKQYSNIIQLGMQYRFKAQYVDAFNAIKEQRALGKIRTISMAEYRPPFLGKVDQWNKFNANSGGTLVEKCCHYFDLINQMADARPSSVYASGGRAVNFLDFKHNGQHSDIDDHAFVIINYDNGIRASFTLNMFCQELYEEMVVVGERGRLVAIEKATFKNVSPSQASLQVEAEGHPLYEARNVGYPDSIEASGHYGATFFEHDAFIDRLEGRPSDGATVSQGMWALIVASAAQASMQQNALIDISEFMAVQGIREPGTDQL